MTSRDGVNRERSFLEAWSRAGPDQKSWTDRSNTPAWGIVESSSGEWSMYVSKHYRMPDHRRRRLVRPRPRLASLHANATSGEFTPRPLTFTGRRLLLSYATAAAGSLQVEIQDESGHPLELWSAAGQPARLGDELAAEVKGAPHHDLATLQGRKIRRRFPRKEADLFALRFAE